MNGLNSLAGNGENNEEMAVDLNIKITHGLNLHEVALPSNSTFGDLKSVLVQKIGLKPQTHMLLFGGEEKHDDENLQTAGVKDNSKMLLVEDKACLQKSPEFSKDTVVTSRGCAAVAEVTAEVDKLSEKISALQATVNGGIKVDNKDIIYLTEMLMRQLLKLDGIEAEGEGKVQRKMEVRRIQSFVETMDVIKSKNLNPFGNVDTNVSVATQWETFEPDWSSATASPIPSTPVPILTPMPTITSTPTASPSSISTQVPASAPSQVQFPSPSRVSPITYPALSSPPASAPSQVQLPSPSRVSRVTYPALSSPPAPAPSQVQLPSPSMVSPVLSSPPASAPSQVQLPSPPRVSPITYPALSSPPVLNPSPTPVNNPSSAPPKMQFFAPMPSSTKVTEDWVQFD